MNTFDSFLVGISPDDWEFFAVDFLNSLGFCIERFPSRGPDGGKDSIVSINNKRYLVSCKQNIISGSAVGTNDETSILDRIIQHNCQGFIGFYSTMLSSGLEERFDKLTNSGYECLTFDKSRITDYLPKISSQVLQKYGIPKGFKYVLNVPDYQYKSLNCLFCGVDILQESMITSSMASICLNDENKLEYLYGCKLCLGKISDLGWVALYQALHQEQLNGWIDWVNYFMDKHPLSSTFYKHKSEFESGIQQRMFPSTWGQWLSF